MRIMKMNKNSNFKHVITLTLLIVLSLSAVAFADPIDNLTTYAQQRITTVFLVIVAFYITKNVAKNATSKLIGFVFIALIGGLFVYKPEFIAQMADWLYNILT